ncbi:MAG: DUF4922 domain-containing protein [Paludibacteraceae bacterium]|jgi:ATP adenylyltransferase/5',5'''-P-1,P-4-tetraphosphate phosphorylase II|nr:DUF4922 domain-containing protein [Paludibacteraceae bacterium]MDI9537588.1 DUF4922 domain-containing protein [Bacteroidota bacterium]HHT61445.1 DUF4922 domain-containing protein [Bacteroidales bacterium]MBP9039436.1 DUF4922 domain-containing protein [Paludibacteraceae bacterium]HOA46804.1 DUF4922 domain-containing protein [Paludibacteraceae bacterium]
MQVQQKVYDLFEEQLTNWEMARKNFAALDSVLLKTFDFDDFKVCVQFNPGRMASSGAKVDAKTIAQRKCFLCEENRPEVQKGVDYGDFVILINPFPIFKKHLTIPRREHIDQHIRPYFKDMLSLAKDLPDFVIFYNGPKCGASAPDHMHFQAGNKDFLPIVNELPRIKAKKGTLISNNNGVEMVRFDNYLRTVYSLESADKEALVEAFNAFFDKLQKGKEEEPMMNVLSVFEDEKWKVYIIVRKAFRPWQYTAEGDKNLMVSPATVEVGGMFITPVPEHFERITKADVIDIMSQLTMQI